MKKYNIRTEHLFAFCVILFIVGMAMFSYIIVRDEFDGIRQSVSENNIIEHMFAHKFFYAKIALTAFIILVFTVLFYLVFQMQKRNIQTLSDRLFVDKITKCPTLIKFKLTVEDILKKHPESKYTIIKMDIEKFRFINQFFGYAEGDKILCNIAKHFTDNMQVGFEAMGKVAVDEFIFLLKYDTDEATISRVEEICDGLEKLVKESFSYKITFSTGMYQIFDNEESIDDIIEKVNIAHKKSKEVSFLNKICIYDEALIKHAIMVKDIEVQMKEALRNNEFHLYLQPKYYIKDNELAGAEALVRWKKDGNDFSSPAQFIPIFEQNGFVTKIDIYIFEQVCKFLNALRSKNHPLIPISINFSRIHLLNSNFVTQLCEIATKYEIPQKYLEVEITETAMLDSPATMVNVINQLHEVGFTLSMDDFGTGYSSLGLLKDIPIDVIKIDQGFFGDNDDAERANIVISNVIRMSKELGIKTVAEGVETKAHIELLKGFKCDIVQGFYYSKPVPAESLLVRNEERQLTNADDNDKQKERVLFKTDNPIDYSQGS